MENRKSKKLLILSASAGIGHLRAAEALKKSAELHYPGVEAVHIDVLSHSINLFRSLYAGGYLRIVKYHPVLWLWLYLVTDGADPNSLSEKILRAFERFFVYRFFRKLQVLNPDCVVCTHFMPAQILSYYRDKGLFDKPIWVQLTDYDCHRYWVNDHIDGYFVGNQEVLNRLQARGISENSIHITGIPVSPVFSQDLDRRGIAGSLGIDSGKFTLLLMSGGYGISEMDKIAEAVIKLENNCQIIVIAGKNRKMFDRIKKLGKRYGGGIVPVGYTDAIEKYMTVSDCAVTKAGGMTTSECLVKGLPMIIVSPIAGQEDRNTDYLLENQAAMKAYDYSSLLFKIQKIMKDHDLRENMKSKAQAIARPNAAKDALSIILKF